MQKMVSGRVGAESIWISCIGRKENLTTFVGLLDVIPYSEKRVISAHRTPDLMFEFARTARERGIGVIIAGAGGAAHVAGVVAGLTTVPVIGVPMQTKALGGLDSLLSIVQMPGGVPVATVAINGAKNAALLAVEILALSDRELEKKLEEYRRQQTETVLKAEI